MDNNKSQKKEFRPEVAVGIAAQVMGAAIAARREIVADDAWYDRVAESSIRGAAAIEAAIPRMEELFQNEEEARVAKENEIQKAKDEADAGAGVAESVQDAVDAGANALEVEQTKQHAIQARQEPKNSEAVSKQNRLDAEKDDEKEASRIAASATGKKK